MGEGWGEGLRPMRFKGLAASNAVALTPALSQRERE
jgi:hypothetical protein